MKKILVICNILFTSCLANAEMVSNDLIGNDPAKERLCISRANGKPIPFEISSRHLEISRQDHPDATFIATAGISVQLVECRLNPGTGKFGPVSMSPEQSYWHPIKPKGFEPGINTDKGKTMASKVCLDTFLTKFKRSGLDHTVNNGVYEVGYQRDRDLIAGKKANRYDIKVIGTALYKSSGLDLSSVQFTCLLSPTLEVKGMSFK